MINFNRIFDDRLDVTALLQKAYQTDPNPSQTLLLSLCIEQLLTRIEKLESRS